MEFRAITGRHRRAMTQSAKAQEMRHARADAILTSGRRLVLLFDDVIVLLLLILGAVLVKVLIVLSVADVVLVDGGEADLLVLLFVSLFVVLLLLAIVVLNTVLFVIFLAWDTREERLVFVTDSMNSETDLRIVVCSSKNETL